MREREREGLLICDLSCRERNNSQLTDSVTRKGRRKTEAEREVMLSKSAVLNYLTRVSIMTR